MDAAPLCSRWERRPRRPVPPRVWEWGEGMDARGNDREERRVSDCHGMCRMKRRDRTDPAGGSSGGRRTQKEDEQELHRHP